MVMVRLNMWMGVRVMLLILGGLVKALRVSGVGVARFGSGVTAGAQTLFLTAIFLFCHLRDAGQLLAVADLRRQFEDPL